MKSPKTFNFVCLFAFLAFYFTSLGFILTSATLIKAQENTALSTYANLERQLALEMELVTIFGILVQEEKREPTNSKLDLKEIETYLKTVKAIHDQIDNKIDEYVSHPMNAFHLIKRLRLRWSVLVEKTLDEDIPYKALRFKLEHLKTSLPSDADYEHFTIGLIRMQYLKKIDLRELVNGMINGKSSLQKPNVADLFLISRIAYDHEDFFTAIMWLKEATRLGQDEDLALMETLLDKPINLTSTMSLHASALYEMRHYKEAMMVLDELLKADPSNKRAQKNREFFKQKSQSNVEPPLEIKWTEPTEEQEQIYQKLCRKEITQSPEKKTHLYCYLHPTIKKILFGKAEILSWKPRLVLFHDMVDTNTTEEINNVGFDQMLSMSDKGSYKYHIQGVSINFKHKVKEQTKLRKHFENLKNLIVPPTLFSNLEVRNFGVQGFFLPLKEPPKTFGGNIGTFLVMLNRTKDGGEIAFPFLNVTVTPKKGSVLFWYSNQIYPSICPVSYGSFWIATQAFYEREVLFCRATEKRPWDLRYKPRRKQKKDTTKTDEKPASNVKL